MPTWYFLKISRIDKNKVLESVKGPQEEILYKYSGLMQDSYNPQDSQRNRRILLSVILQDSLSVILRDSQRFLQDSQRFLKEPQRNLQDSLFSNPTRFSLRNFTRFSKKLARFSKKLARFFFSNPTRFSKIPTRFSKIPTRISKKLKRFSHSNPTRFSKIPTRFSKIPTRISKKLK